MDILIGFQIMEYAYTQDHPNMGKNKYEKWVEGFLVM